MHKRFFVHTVGLLFALFFVTSGVSGQTEERPFEVGGLITTIDLNDSIGEKPLGIGGRFTYNFTDNFALDSEVSYFPQDPGGNFGETVALVGLRAGIRGEKFGIFAKIRPGIAHFDGDAFTALNDGGSKFALDAGGVLEFYPSSRVIVRADFGDTIIPFGDEVINTAVPPFTIRPGTTHNFQASFGIGFRF